MGKLTRISGLFVSAVALVAACGASDSEPTDAQPASTSQAPTQDAPQEATQADTGSGCDLLAETDIAELFDGSVPAGNDATVGEEFRECVWEQGDVEVSLAVLPRAFFVDEFAPSMAAQKENGVDGLGESHVYAGVIGVARGSAKGKSVSFTTDDFGGFASVKIDADDDPESRDRLEAERLARIIVKNL